MQLVLQEYPELFEGVIGQLKIPPVHFELKDGALPFAAKPFPIPKAYEHLTRLYNIRPRAKGCIRRLEELDSY